MVLLAILTVSTGGARPQAAEPEKEEKPAVKLSASDRAAITRLALQVALEKKKIPDYKLLRNPRRVVISTSNLKLPPPRLRGVKLIPLSPKAIQARANKRGDFLYLRLGVITAGPNGPRLWIYNRWVLSARSIKRRKIMLSGGALLLEFSKVQDGGWRAKAIITVRS
jgi:hypothetical protein